MCTVIQNANAIRFSWKDAGNHSCFSVIKLWMFFSMDLFYRNAATVRTLNACGWCALKSQKNNSISIDSYFLGNYFWRLSDKNCAKQVDVMDEFANQLLPRNIHYRVIPTRLDEWCSTAISMDMNLAKYAFGVVSNMCMSKHCIVNIESMHCSALVYASVYGSQNDPQISIEQHRNENVNTSISSMRLFLIVLFWFFWRKVPLSK